MRGGVPTDVEDVLHDGRVDFLELCNENNELLRFAVD